MSKWLEAKKKNNDRKNIDSYTHSKSILKTAFKIDDVSTLEKNNNIEFKSNSDFNDFIYTQIGLTPIQPIAADDTLKEKTRLEQLKERRNEYMRAGKTDTEIKEIMKKAGISEAEITETFKKDEPKAEVKKDLF